MPDVTRSDSQKSDTSLRPRVSFNRDVHVKRIVPRESGRVTGALSGDGAGHIVTSPVRKEPLNKSKKELAEEAARVLQQADSHTCVTQDKGVLPEKFYTLPRKTRKPETFTSLDRRVLRRNNVIDEPPRKPPRTFATVSNPHSPSRPSIFDIFKKNEKKQESKKSNIKRSVSDTSHLKRYDSSNSQLPPIRKNYESKDTSKLSVSNKKQLSPIIEDIQRSDYFSEAKTENKENINNNQSKDNESPTRKKWKKEDSVTEQLKQYIDEIDEVLFKETGFRTNPEKDVKTPEIIIIDVDKAEKISKNKKSRFKDSVLGKKLRSISKRGSKTNDAKKAKKASAKYSKQITPIEELEKIVRVESKSPVNSKAFSSPSPAPKIKEAIESLENQSKRSPAMIHSSQQPPEKPPLTKGQTVDTMVKRLANDKSSSPPPKTNILITPTVSMQHNNNQPFSYTRGLSPDARVSNETSPSPGSPIIYAQVVCGNGSNGPLKQTVHTAYPNGRKHPQHSDSDEGLGYEENMSFGNRKYISERTMTHFGDERYDISRNDSFGRDDYLNDHDKFEEETPITPKFRNTSYVNGFTSTYDKKYDSNYRSQHKFVDSSSRGRGDGMDSKRRESLSEPFEDGYTPPKTNGISNVRSDLSARRDLLESRINRRLNDKNMRLSPEYVPQSTPTNVFVSEIKSKYYKSGSASPVGYRERYVSETKINKHGVSNIESRNKEYLGDIDENQKRLNYSGYDNEPKSFDSQISDYRSSPENRIFETSHNKSTNNRYANKLEKQKIFKDRDYYRSNPEIHQEYYRDTRYEESYHDSLRREKHENKVNLSKFRSERFLDQSECERKDKFGDSGIENDFKRDSGDSYRTSRPINSNPEYCNDSEDEGFASSLLIASERQHTEDNFGQRKNKKDYDTDRTYSREDDPYRHLETMEYRSSRSRQEYVPRERSIDDGSHYDPRIDKDIDKSTLKRLEKKPPKPEKKSGLEKMKQLFSRDNKKKKDKAMVREESLRARYTEYKGGRDEVDAAPVKRKEVTKLDINNDYKNRRRIATPSPSPTRDIQRNGKTENTHSSWLKSLDRLSRKKTKKDEKDSSFRSMEGESVQKPTPAKNLRFFGDTDIESNDSIRYRSKFRNGIVNKDQSRSQSTRDLHNISEESRNPSLVSHRNAHKSMQNLSESDREVKNSTSHLKPPMSPNHRATREIRPKDERTRRRKNEVSSVESSTEGDSSQQSQRSIVYLHAATVGDIPGPGYLRNGRRAASREELASNGSSRIQPQVKTLSRSFSVLAPWRPRHRDNMDIDYTQYQKPTKNGKYEQKAVKNGSSRKENSSTLKKKAQETRRSNQSTSTLNRQSRSKENLSSQTLRRSPEEISKGSTSTLYKKKERLPRENSRYNNRDEKKMSAKSMSVESLGSGRSGRKSREEVSRSVSMPRDPEKSAGWFKMNRKSKSKSGSTQRL